MGIAQIFTLIVLTLFLGWFVWRLSKRAKEDRNTPNDNFDISSLRKIHLGPAGSIDPGDPETVSRVEKHLKQEASRVKKKL
jgi:hypothetical protein